MAKKAPKAPAAAGATCPKCGSGRLRSWTTRPRPHRLVRTSRCLGCGHEVRTSERVKKLKRSAKK